MIAIALASFALSLLAPQEPPEVLARFRLDGKDAVVTRTELAVDLAFHLRRRDRGKQAVDLLVDTALTHAAATKKGLLPSDAEVDAFWQQLQQQLREAGHRPDDFAAVRNTSAGQWRRDLAVQMAQERLVRLELGLRADEAVSPDMLKLWLQEARKKSKVETDPDALPAGVAARVDGVDVPILDLGLLLLRTSEDVERDEAIRKIVVMQTVDALARRENVTLTDADLDAAVQQRRDEASRDPRMRGIGFDQFLKGEGLTPQSLRELRTFRSHVMLGKIAEKRFPDRDLLAEVQRDRQRVLDLVGPRRQLSVVFVRAMEEPNGLVTRDFAAATKQLEEARRRLANETFDNVARIVSEDARTKANGGDVGWHRRHSDRLAEPVLAAAFALPKGEVSMPVRTDEGCWIVKVVDVEPDPADPQLVDLLRAYRVQELRLRIVKDAAIELVSATPEVRK